MTTHVIGIKAPGKKWRQMKAVWDACFEAGVEAPNEVQGYFGGHPCQGGLRVQIPAKHFSQDMESGFDVLVSEIPADVTIIRFTNSY